MEQIFALMIFFGSFTFLLFGLCTNSIKAKESKTVENIMTFIAITCMVSFSIGFAGLIICITI
jgi:hypothetical protein